MYEIKYQDMDVKKWKNKKYADYYFIKEIPNSLIDNVGIVGEELFELSLDSLGSGFDMGLAPIKGVGINEIEAYNLMCPELETFVSVVLWLKYDNESACKNENFGDILYEYIEKKDVNKKCVIKGNYRLRNEHFGDVLPFHGSIEIRKKHNSYYEWERAPFLKRSAEVCTYYTSPLFMSSFPDDTTGVSKISVFTMPFKCRQTRGNYLEIVVPSCTTYSKALLNVAVSNQNITTKLDNHLDEYYMGLFREKVMNDNGRYWRIFELINISDTGLTVNDFLGHFISQRMYYAYLKNNHLKICTSKELEKYIKFATLQIYKNYDVEPNHFFDFEIFKLVYLNKYFVEINDCWYYKPYIFKNLNNEQYALFLKYLDGNFSHKKCAGYDVLKAFEIEKQFEKYKKYLNFLNTYNYYSKRDLINIINKGGGYKWRMTVRK